MSDCHSTRSRFPAGNPHYREHARAAIALARQSPGAAPTPEQALVLERIAVRMHGRANRHELGTWRENPDVPGGEVLGCLHCGALAYVSRQTGSADVRAILVRCSA
jgi:hypothetical protein